MQITLEQLQSQIKVVCGRDFDPTTIFKSALELKTTLDVSPQLCAAAVHELTHEFYITAIPKVCDPDPKGGRIVDLFIVTDEPVSHAVSVALRKSLGSGVEEQSPCVTHAFYLRCQGIDEHDDEASIKAKAYKIAYDRRVRRIDFVRAASRVKKS
jgi:hypothetical protein